MSGIPDNIGQQVSSDASIAEVYRQARERENVLMCNAPFIEICDGWGTISLVDLQTAVALGHRAANAP